MRVEESNSSTLYFLLRSPVRNVTYIYAYSVSSNGNTGNNITDISNSYGINSPDTSYDYILDNRNFVIEWDGSIDGLNDPDYSYGPLRAMVICTHLIYT